MVKTKDGIPLPSGLEDCMRVPWVTGVRLLRCRDNDSDKVLASFSLFSRN